MIVQRLFKLLFPDPKDKRDKKFKNTSVNRKTVASLPNRIHWGTRLTWPPINQGNLGSCVGCAGVSGLQLALNYLEGVEHFDLSEQWLYFKAEEIDNHAPQGTYIRCAMKIMHTLGVPFEKVWPYRANFNRPGTPKKPYEPLYKISSYHRITTVDQLLKAVTHTLGFVVAAVRINEGCMDTHIWKDVTGKDLGGHAIHIVGFDQGKEEIYFANSWGENWGFSGQGIMSYDFFKKHLMDCWFARLI